MDADIQWWEQCRPTGSAVKFVIESPEFYSIVCGSLSLWYILLSLNIVLGERGGACFGASAGVEGCKFSRLSLFCLCRTVDRHFSIVLQPFE